VAQPLPSRLEDYRSQLAALGGLKLEYFYNALRAGEQARRLVTKNDPRTAGGTDDYFKRVRVLREQLIEALHWARGELDGLSLVVSPDRKMAIGVLLGDHQTGWVGPYHPRSKRPVGENKVGLVAQNGQQEVLFKRPLVADEVDLEAEDLFQLKTWFFLTHRRPLRDGIVVVSSELSLPFRTNPTGYVDRWIHRIPFPDLRFENVTPHIDDDESDDGGYDVAVDEK
jgi:hypothetical protein